MLRSKIQDDLIVSLKAKSHDRVEALRLLLSEIKNVEIDAKHELSDEEVTKVLRFMNKKLKEAMEMFKKGGRSDLEKQNQVQVDIYAEYLPAELDDSALSEKVDALMTQHKALFDENPKTVIPTIMKALSAEVDPQKIMAEIKKRI